MRIDPSVQGSEAWKLARLGLPTASCFHRILTPMGKPSGQQDKYLAALAAEYYLGYPLDDDRSAFMQRGSEMEEEAVAYYAFERDASPVKVGLCLTDDGKAGASPDRLVGDDGLLEVKCPTPEVQMLYYLGGVENEYRVQAQGQLLVTCRKWVDLLCYSPLLPKVLVRFPREEEFIDTLAKAVKAFSLRLDEVKARLSGEDRPVPADDPGSPF